MYLERLAKDTEKLPPFRQRPPQFASKQSGEGGSNHAGRVTRAFRRKIPEKAFKNTDFHSTPGSDLRREAGTAECLPFKLSYARSSLAQDKNKKTIFSLEGVGSLPRQKYSEKTRKTKVSPPKIIIIQHNTKLASSRNFRN